MKKLSLPPKIAPGITVETIRLYSTQIYKKSPVYIRTYRGEIVLPVKCGFGRRVTGTDKWVFEGEEDEKNLDHEYCLLLETE